MGTLNPYVKINKRPLGRWVSIKNWFHWKLRMSKMPWGKLYRHFWRKRLMKRIVEVSNIIQERTYRPHVRPVPLILEDSKYSIPGLIPGMYVYKGVPVIEQPSKVFILPVIE